MTAPPPPAGAAPREGPEAQAVPAPTDLDLGALEDAARSTVGEMAYAYYAGGAEDEALLADNERAWRAWRLHPKTLRDVSRVSTATTVLGSPAALPVLLAPTAIQRMAHPEGEVATARGAADAGTCMVLSSVSTCSLEEVAAAVPDGLRWMQIYVQRDRGRTVELVQRAASAGYRGCPDGGRPGVGAPAP